jgi:hypothetical protein
VSTDDHTNEPATRHPIADHAPTQQYEIRVGGHLGSRWSTWFDGLTLTCENDGTSVIRGFVVDQAALHGLLQKLRDLGITLISLTSIVPEAAIEHPNESRHQPHHHSPGAATS